MCSFSNWSDDMHIENLPDYRLLSILFVRSQLPCRAMLHLLYVLYEYCFVVVIFHVFYEHCWGELNLILTLLPLYGCHPMRFMVTSAILVNDLFLSDFSLHNFHNVYGVDWSQPSQIWGIPHRFNHCNLFERNDVILF